MSTFPIADIPPEFTQHMRRTVSGQRAVLVAKGDLVLTVYNFDDDLPGQLAADVCDTHLKYLCEDCFDFTCSTDEAA